MITFKFKSSIALLLIGLVAGFCLSFLFNGCSKNDGFTHEKITPVKNLQKEADAKEASYQAKITELEHKNESLQQELSTTKGQLAIAKSKSKNREENIKKIIEPKGYPAKEVLQKIKPASITNTELSPCDSLASEVSEYIQENLLKDSLYDLQITTLDSIIAGKDSVIDVKTRQHQDLQTSFEKSLVQQEILEKTNSQLKKQFKRQKFRSKIVALGITVLSGLAANYIIQH